MARPKTGSGVEVLSISVPRELAEELRRHGNISKIVTSILKANLDLISNLTSSEAEEAKRAYVVQTIKPALREALVKILDEVLEEYKTTPIEPECQGWEDED